MEKNVSKFDEVFIKIMMMAIVIKIIFLRYMLNIPKTFLISMANFHLYDEEKN